MSVSVSPEEPSVNSCPKAQESLTAKMHKHRLLLRNLQARRVFLMQKREPSFRTHQGLFSRQQSVYRAEELKAGGQSP